MKIVNTYNIVPATTNIQQLYVANLKIYSYSLNIKHLQPRSLIHHIHKNTTAHNLKLLLSSVAQETFVRGPKREGSGSAQ